VCESAQKALRRRWSERPRLKGHRPTSPRLICTFHLEIRPFLPDLTRTPPATFSLALPAPTTAAMASEDTFLFTSESVNEGHPDKLSTR